MSEVQYTIRDAINRLKEANATGKTNLFDKGVDLPADEPTTTEVVDGIEDIQAGISGGYNVLFKNGNSDYYFVSVPQGESIVAPQDATQPDLFFSGWYTSQVGGSKIVFPYTPIDDITLYAQYTEFDVLTIDKIILLEDILQGTAGTNSITLDVAANNGVFVFQSVSNKADNLSMSFDNSTFENNISALVSRDATNVYAGSKYIKPFSGNSHSYTLNSPAGTCFFGGVQVFGLFGLFSSYKMYTSGTIYSGTMSGITIDDDFDFVIICGSGGYDNVELSTCTVNNVTVPLTYHGNFSGCSAHSFHTILENVPSGTSITYSTYPKYLQLGGAMCAIGIKV